MNPRKEINFLKILFALGVFLIFNIFSTSITLAYGECEYGQGIYGEDCETVDSTAPTGSIVINSNNEYTNSTTVTLTISATDNSSTVSQMIISENQSFSGANWESYSTNKTFTTSSNDGTKTIYVKFKDGANNESETYSDGIILDMTPPTGSLSINNGDSSTNSRNVTLKIQAIDNTGVSTMMISENSNFDSISWESYQTEKGFTLSSGNGTKSVYIKFRDLAGNLSNTYFDTIEYSPKSSGNSDGNNNQNGSQNNIGDNDNNVDDQDLTPPLSFPDTPIGGETPDSNQTFYKLKITDLNGEPLVGAKVTIQKLNIKAISDESGYINLGYIPPGTYTIEIEYEGKVLGKTITVGTNREVILKVSEISVSKGNSGSENTSLIIAGVIGIIVISGGVIFLLKKSSKSNSF